MKGPPSSEAGSSRQSHSTQAVKREDHGTSDVSTAMQSVPVHSQSPVCTSAAAAPSAHPQGRESAFLRSASHEKASPPAARRAGHWDAALGAFLRRMGLTQALRGLALDVLAMSPARERAEAPRAVDELVRSLAGAATTSFDEHEGALLALEERKLEYIRTPDGAQRQPQSQAQLTKAVSLLLARSRTRNGASNAREFLHPPRPGADGARRPTCARTDARPVDRDVQMRYDIAKNEEGPLRRTVRARDEGAAGQEEREAGRPGKRVKIEDGEGVSSTDTADKMPATDERLRNIETHLAVRYVPGMPRSLSVRLKYLEDHIIRLEKEYPPWAALHFNQPRRGWPPPPRPTPIIVPSHTTDASPPAPPPAAAESAAGAAADNTGAGRKGKGKQRREESSLHRAVMERLEVQRALSDMRGDGMEGAE